LPEYRAFLHEDEKQGYIDAYVDHLDFADLGAPKPDVWSRVGLLRIAKAERRQYRLKVDDLWTEWHPTGPTHEADDLP
jgi:hypothetical protein